MIVSNSYRLAAFSAALSLALLASPVHADWKSCQGKPNRACLLEEALRGDSGPLAGKDRLDVLVQSDIIGFPEFMTADDIDQAVQQGKSPAPDAFRAAQLAVRVLVAINQKQRAGELVASLRGATQNLMFAELVRALGKAGDTETGPALYKQMSPTFDSAARNYLGHLLVTETVKSLAEAGKIDEALPLMMAAQDFPERDIAEMQMAVAIAYTKRGDAKMAQRYLDLAGQTLDKGLRYAIGGGAEQLRLTASTLAVLRGDTGVARTELQNLREAPAGTGSAERLSAYNRGQAFQRMVMALIQTRQYPLALEIAKSAPDLVRDTNLLMVSIVDAQNGQIDDARAALAALSEKFDVRGRAAAIRSIAVAMTKAGKLAAAVDMAAQIGDPVARKGALLSIALNLPK